MKRPERFASPRSPACFISARRGSDPPGNQNAIFLAVARVLTRFPGLISESDTIGRWRHPHPETSRFPSDIRESLKKWLLNKAERLAGLPGYICWSGEADEVVRAIAHASRRHQNLCLARGVTAVHGSSLNLTFFSCHNFLRSKIWTRPRHEGSSVKRARNERERPSYPRLWLCERFAAVQYHASLHHSDTSSSDSASLHDSNDGCRIQPVSFESATSVETTPTHLSPQAVADEVLGASTTISGKRDIEALVESGKQSSELVHESLMIRLKQPPQAPQLYVSAQEEQRRHGVPYGRSEESNNHPVYHRFILKLYPTDGGETLAVSIYATELGKGIEIITTSGPSCWGVIIRPCICVSCSYKAMCLWTGYTRRAVAHDLHSSRWQRHPLPALPRWPPQVLPHPQCSPQSTTC
ncbi:hypothetical protein AUEXF2481DRAFT_292456 [Aureobasidium subglaciale EXF-2481]|uniref:Uncharacterized protein n=1 Tax=Aureobasidium subglaciale (strain EXF-2481) TaxID=1043005 RepID=A0A074YDG0_AURSE|nr:uncharacterized protein AUEXF2481DRAFT_292456 [Aureobasidium subglaciale EXF-2481]KEQ94089.1 hypothetical protein AUEXF2481DRAFT_292456 [Aureobasidium subglaciale EXF-2481]